MIVLGEISIAGLALATSQLATTDLPECSHQPGPDFIFFQNVCLGRNVSGKKCVVQGSFQHSWFSKWPFLHYNEAEDTVFCYRTNVIPAYRCQLSLFECDKL